MVKYRNYIKSDAWKSNPARLKVLADADGRCRLCHAKAKLEVHYSTYERLGCERETDLIPLCRRCHREVTSFLRARRYAAVTPRRADVIQLRDPRTLQTDPTVEVSV